MTGDGSDKSETENTEDEEGGNLTPVRQASVIRTYYLIVTASCSFISCPKYINAYLVYSYCYVLLKEILFSAQSLGFKSERTSKRLENTSTEEV